MGSLATVAFGVTDMRISRVGLGAWAFGGAAWFDAWGEQDDAESVATIRYGVESGINWIDTAPVYGLGHAEEVVGRALQAIPEADRPCVFTKAGVIWDEKNPFDEPRLVGNPASIRQEVEASLRRLGVDRIDLYQMHAPATDATVEDYWEAFLDLKREGKVRAVGLSNHNLAQLNSAEALGHVDSLQPLFNAIHRDAAADVLPWCADHGTGVIVYSPMASGLLTGAFSHERAARLAPDDWRHRHAEFNGARLQRNLALADALRSIAERHGVSVAAAAVAWTLTFPVTGAIVGARRPAQIDGWIAAGDLELDEADIAEIATAIDRTAAGSGPARP